MLEPTATWTSVWCCAGGARPAVEHHRWLRDLAGRLEPVCPGASVDLVILEAQGPVFAHRVLCEGRRVYEADRDRRVDFESEVVVRALDFLPTYEQVARHYVEGVRSWLKGRR